MAKVVTLHGARPGGWAKERWEWIGAVAADGSLTPLARLVAVILAQGFANHETAECRPGLAALMVKVASSKRTVLRALEDLQAAGWLERRGGNAPGKLATYVFRRPGARQQVPTVTPEQVPTVTPEQVPTVTPTGAIPDTSPCTPYKDKPHMNHKAHLHPRAAIRGLPMPQCLTTVIPENSLAAERWDAWLAAEGFPPLARIGKRLDGGWQMPVTVAPTNGEEIPYGIARRWAEWLRSKA
ncbi:MAG: hypothetical protein U1E58_10125 [Tabrizicola sp.]